MRSPLRLLPQWVRETGFAFALCAVAVVIILAHHGDARVHGAWIGALTPALLAVGVLIARRRSPLGVLAVVCAIALAAPDSAAVMIPVLLAALNVALRSERRAIALAGPVALGTLVLSGALHNGLGPNQAQKSLSLTMSAALAVVVIAGWVVVWLGAGAWRTRVRDA